MYVDTTSHNLYTAEPTNRLVRSVTPTGTMNVVMSTNTSVPWLNMTMFTPIGVAVGTINANHAVVFFSCGGN